MTHFFRILFTPKTIFQYLDKQFTGDLNKHCNYILLLLGAFSGLESFWRNASYLGKPISEWGFFITSFLAVCFGACMSLLFGKYIAPLIIHGIGKWLKGKAEFTDIQIVVAYSMIPLFFKIPIVFYLGMSGKFSAVVGVEYWVVNLLYLGISLWVMFISLNGIRYHQKFNYNKALLTISPFLVWSITIYILYGFFN